MKRIILIAICVFATLANMAVNTQPVNPTLTNSEIAAIVAMSKEANMANGVLNPDLIQPGQQLTFLFQDGNIGTITVGAGDTQWSIVRTKLAEMQVTHGDVVEYVDNTPVKPEVVTPKKDEQQAVVAPVVQESSIDWSFWLWAGFWSIVALGLVLAINRLRYKNPATAGPAYRPSGIRYGQENEHQTVTEAFRGQYGGENSRIENVRRCLISTPGITRRRVRFANNTTQMLMLRKERGYEANVDGVIRYIIGDCANGFGAASRHMTGEGLIIEYMENVINPTTTHNPANTGIQVSTNKEQLDALVKVSQNVTTGLGEFSKNGGKINLTVSRKVGEGEQAVTDSVHLSMELNAPANDLPALNGVYKAYMLTPLKKGEVVEVQKAEKTA